MSVRVADIGFPQDLLHADAYVMEPADVAAVLPERDIDTHKRATGVLVVVAGSRDMTGAAHLVAEAAGRIGAGLVQVAVPAGILPIVQSQLVETTFLALPETADGSVALAALGILLDRLEGADALAIGPGLSTNDETAELDPSAGAGLPGAVGDGRGRAERVLGASCRTDRPEVRGGPHAARRRVRPPVRRVGTRARRRSAGRTCEPWPNGPAR